HALRRLPRRPEQGQIQLRNIEQLGANALAGRALQSGLKDPQTLRIAGVRTSQTDDELLHGQSPPWSRRRLPGGSGCCAHLTGCVWKAHPPPVRKPAPTLVGESFKKYPIRERYENDSKPAPSPRCPGPLQQASVKHLLAGENPHRLY